MPGNTNLKKVVVMAAGLVGLVALCVAAVLLPGSGPRETARTSSSEERGRVPGSDRATVQEPTMIGGHRVLTGREALVQDARWYARDVGVPLKEAIRRLQMQDDTLPSTLERELKKSEGDTFAGLWLRHKPDYGLNVATAGDPEAMMQKIEPFVAGTQWEGTVNVRQVEATEAQLNAARAEAEGMLDKLGIRYSSGDAIMKNRMEIYVRNESRVERKLRAAGFEWPAHVVLIEGVDVPT